MHGTSFEKMAAFVDLYLTDLRTAQLSIVDFGSRQVSEQVLSYRSLFDAPAWSYRGIDLEDGLNVDVVLDQPFEWPEIATESVDLIISGQALEHVDYFWVTAFEMGRALKPGGMIVLIAPSRGPEHRFPVDCWRFYPDGFRALCTLLGFELLDVHTDWDRGDWADSLVVMRKPEWDVENRRAFLRRHQFQLAAALADRDPDLNPVCPPEPSRSPLHVVPGGELTRELARIRDADAAAPTPGRRTAALRALLARFRRVVRSRRSQA